MHADWASAVVRLKKVLKPTRTTAKEPSARPGGASMSLHQGQVFRSGFVPQQVQHGPRGVQTGDLQPVVGQRQGQPSGADAQFQYRSAPRQTGDAIGDIRRCADTGEGNPTVIAVPLVVDLGMSIPVGALVVAVHGGSLTRSGGAANRLGRSL
jgi:hypothetical protein